MSDPDMYVARVPWDPPQYDTILLEKLRVRSMQRFSNEVVERMRIETWREFALDSLVACLEAEIYAEKVHEEKIHIEDERTTFFYFPRSVWQHFKQNQLKGTRLFGWFVRRWPVLNSCEVRKVPFNKTITVEQLAVFPMSPIKTPPSWRGPVITRYERVQ